MLNASRHHRKNRTDSPNRRGIASRCSTPRGITGKIAQDCEALRSWGQECAQRLAASQEKSRSNPGRSSISTGCSTPRGITGKIAGVWRLKRFCQPCAQRLAASQEKSHAATEPGPSLQRVLNASRHHRKNRDRPFLLFALGARRAQRLAASQEKSRSAIRSAERAISSAQRLAASQEKSPTRAERLRLRTAYVLNASRHHRKNRKRNEVVIRLIWRCSTPRGITGKIAALLSRAYSISSRAQRLAASQEKSLVQGVTNYSCHMCSTPRGITGKIALVRQAPSVDDTSAQRLAASQEKSLLFRNPLLRSATCAQRLAASQEKSLTTGIASLSTGESAQRLAASQEKSRRRSVFITVRGNWCSTPRGITGKIAIT